MDGDFQSFPFGVANEAIAKSVFFYDVLFLIISVLLLVDFVKCLVNFGYWMKDVLVIISFTYIVIRYP